MSEKEVNKLSEKRALAYTGALLIDLDGRNYYLVYEKTDIQDWVFLGLAYERPNANSAAMAQRATGNQHPDRLKDG